MAIIQCQNCGNDVSDKAKQCPHCQTVINDDNGIENILNKVKIKTQTTNSTNNYNKRIYNRVANKFNTVVFIVKFLGYFAGFIWLILLAQNDNFLMGLGVCIGIFIITWFSTLIFEAIAEGLQLLEDIRNK